MIDLIIPDKVKVLTDNGLTQNQATLVLAGGIYFEKMGGTPVEKYWNDPESFDIRDEFYLISTIHFLLARLVQKVDPEGWLQCFQVTYLYHLKLNAQCVKSIDILISQKCYADAFAVCRALQSRVNLLLLFGFSPELFDHWVKDAKDSRYLDGRIRQELEAHGVFTMSHLYELASEIIHGQHLGHANIGYYEKGLFVDIPAIKNQLFVIAKFLLAITSYAVLQATIIGPKKETKLKDVEEIDRLFEKLFDSVLAPNRIDHLSTMIGEERHWKKTGKDKFEVGGAYGFHHYRDQLLKFHRQDKQKKQLSKKYRI